MKCPYCYGTGEMPDTFGAKLKAVLEERGISIYRLQGMTGISNPVLARAIRSSTAVNPRYAKIIAEALEVPVESLLPAGQQ